MLTLEVWSYKQQDEYKSIINQVMVRTIIWCSGHGAWE